MIDSIIIIAAVVAIGIASELTRDVAHTGRIAVIALVAVLVLYEPIMVARFGATVGHRAMNLRVVDERTGSNPGFLRAFVRFLVKAALGILSFTTMALTRRRQAVHDSLTNTTVQIRDLARARPVDFRAERTPTPPGTMPSIARRIVVIIAYMVALLVAFALTSAVATSPACLNEALCTPGEELVSTTLTLVWMALSVGVLIAGWRGRLFGCRARPLPPADDDAAEPPAR
jgi:uncharacterized RDD family membrane protein YckC